MSVLLTLLTSTRTFQLHLRSFSACVCLIPNVPALPLITRGLLPHADVKQNGNQFNFFNAVLSVTRTLSQLLSTAFPTYTHVHTHLNKCTYSTKMQTRNRTNAHPYAIMHMLARTHTHVVSYFYCCFIHAHTRERTNAHANIKTYTLYIYIYISPPSLPKSFETTPKRRIRTKELVNIRINQ